jgi:hypothetical protein
MFLRCEVVSLTPNPQTGGQLLVGCLLLIQYTCSHLKYLKVYSPICTRGTHHAVVTGTCGFAITAETNFNALFILISYLIYFNIFILTY